MIHEVSLISKIEIESTEGHDKMGKKLFKLEVAKIFSEIIYKDKDKDIRDKTGS